MTLHFLKKILFCCLSFASIPLLAFAPIAAEAQQTYVSPSKLMAPTVANKLSGQDSKALQSAFQYLVTKKRSFGSRTGTLSLNATRALSISNIPTLMMHDPQTNRSVDAYAVASFALAVQDAYQAQHLALPTNGEPINLAVVRSYLDNVQQPNLVKLTPPDNSVFLASPKAETPRAGATGPTCAVSASPSIDELAGSFSTTWQLIQNYDADPTKFGDFCQLPFASAVQTADANASAVTATIPVITVPFGYKAYLEGDWNVTPSLTLGAAGGFTAGVETSLKTVVLTNYRNTIVDSSASVVVPSPSSRDGITTKIVLGGNAFPVPLTYQNAAPAGQFTVTGNPTVDYTFFSFQQSFPVHYLLINGAITASVDLKGKASVNYTLNANGSGMYVLITPTASASAVGALTATGGIILSAGVTGTITVQNGNSQIGALVAPISYDGKIFVVDRAFESYAPVTLVGNVVASGHLFGFPWTWPIVTIPQQLLTPPFSQDSNWQVSRIDQTQK